MTYCCLVRGTQLLVSTEGCTPKSAEVHDRHIATDIRPSRPVTLFLDVRATGEAKQGRLPSNCKAEDTSSATCVATEEGEARCVAPRVLVDPNNRNSVERPRVPVAIK